MCGNRPKTGIEQWLCPKRYSRQGLAGINPSYFKLWVRWPRLLAQITDYSKLIGTRSLAAITQRELFWV
ncbi:MAG TPA: hypothetical protein VJY99_00050 [Buttiauxella sp.]|uniref:hypothetical protein n=1 Tax=Buttiauxella sp. TaxID=1972222 RepID=UPI002B493572|nr:hypothetical protein [Buttiauxella sp.]HKM95093.1 hypothetical protein [Buttiauxella sp.]